MSEESTQDLSQNEDFEQYLTYTIGDSIYGVKLLSVQEIRGWESVARVPNTPKYIKGVLNLRGTAVPIVDMRMRSKCEHVTYDPTTVLIILRGEVQEKERIAGIVVDAVSDVLNTEKSKVRKTPDFSDSIDVDFINGLADSDGQMVMLFDAIEFLKSPDLYDQVIVAEDA